MADNRETLQIVVVGHVDHGKSTLIGRRKASLLNMPICWMHLKKNRSRE